MSSVKLLTCFFLSPHGRPRIVCDSLPSVPISRKPGGTTLLLMIKVCTRNQNLSLISGVFQSVQCQAFFYVNINNISQNSLPSFWRDVFSYNFLEEFSYFCQVLLNYDCLQLWWFNEDTNKWLKHFLLQFFELSLRSFVGTIKLFVSSKSRNVCTSRSHKEPSHHLPRRKRNSLTNFFFLNAACVVDRLSWGAWWMTSGC